MNSEEIQIKPNSQVVNKKIIPPKIKNEFLSEKYFKHQIKMINNNKYNNYKNNNNKNNHQILTFLPIILNKMTKI